MLSRFGSFASPDPLGLDFPDDWIGDALNLNLYAYAARNPLAFVDPTGLEVDSEPSFLDVAIQGAGEAAQHADSLINYLYSDGYHKVRSLGGGGIMLTGHDAINAYRIRDAGKVLGAAATTAGAGL